MMQPYKLLDLFSGIGGFSLGLERSRAFETVAFCEIESFPRKVLAKHWPKVPCYHDIRELTAAKLAADGIAVDAICGGFPCQDLSVAGKQAGIEGERSGLWREYVRLIDEIRPCFVAMENVTGLLNGGLSVILGALAKIGYDAVWHCIRAARFGLPHIRDRIWIIAHPCGQGWQGLVENYGIFGGAFTPQPKRSDEALNAWLQMVFDKCGLRSSDGVSLALERSRLKALGNAVVPQVAELIGKAIGESFERA